MSEESLQHALGIAYAYLNRRERTDAEMRLRLEREAIDSEAIEAAVTALTEQGYLDDARYGRLFVQDKRALDGWGSERIRRGLTARGVERELIEAALADSGDEQSELDRALALLARRFPEPPRERGERERALGLLLRRGYESELALDALNAYVHGARAV